MSVVETLLAGPRGRRLLLEYALTADRLSNMQSQNSFHMAVFLAAYHLDVDHGSGGGGGCSVPGGERRGGRE
ncbi:hypothetical protein RhoFasK5_01718|nr:hypothetical protein [Rhodococcus kroppenstedtii]